MTPAVCYYRFSPRPNAQECDSIERQRERIHAYCLAHNYQIVGEHEDAAASGETVAGREGFQAAVDQACKAKATLVFYDLFRFARNTVEAIQTADRLRQAGANLASLREHIDTSSASGRMFFTIMAAVGTWQRESTAERTSAAMVAHQYQHGRRMTRVDRLPYGYRLMTGDVNRIVKDPGEQEAIALIGALVREGYTLGRIARKLNREGPRCRGNPWCWATLKKIIKREKLEELV